MEKLIRVSAKQLTLEDLTGSVAIGQKSRSVSRETLVARVKRDVLNIAAIYPTAFNLYEEPLDRLARRIVSTLEKSGGVR